jgi:hypothetical protein
MSSLVSLAFAATQYAVIFLTADRITIAYGEPRRDQTRRHCGDNSACRRRRNSLSRLEVKMKRTFATIGREVPNDLFRVELPSQPNAEGRVHAPRLGMTTTDVEEVYGAPHNRVDYVFNGQPSLHEVYKVSETGRFVALTFVDGVATELEDLGRMPDDLSLQGR